MSRITVMQVQNYGVYLVSLTPNAQTGNTYYCWCCFGFLKPAPNLMLWTKPSPFLMLLLHPWSCIHVAHFPSLNPSTASACHSQGQPVGAGRTVPKVHEAGCVSPQTGFPPKRSSTSSFFPNSLLLILRQLNQVRLSCPWVPLEDGPGAVYNFVVCDVLFQHISHISESGKRNLKTQHYAL